MNNSLYATDSFARLHRSKSAVTTPSAPPQHSYLPRIVLCVPIEHHNKCPIHSLPAQRGAMAHMLIKTMRRRQRSPLIGLRVALVRVTRAATSTSPKPVPASRSKRRVQHQLTAHIIQGNYGGKSPAMPSCSWDRISRASCSLTAVIQHAITLLGNQIPCGKPDSTRKA